MHLFLDDIWTTSSEDVCPTSNIHFYAGFGLDNISKAQWMRELPHAVGLDMEEKILKLAKDQIVPLAAL